MARDRELEKSSAMLFIWMMCANVGNYLFQIVAGRLLSVTDYGVFNSLNSLTGLLAVACTASAAVCCRASARESGGEMPGTTYGALLRLACAAAAVLWLATALLSPALAKLLKVERAGMVRLCALSAAVGTVGFVPAGIAQGQKRFAVYGSAGAVGVAAKLAALTAFLYVGWGAYGALLAVTVYYLAYGAYAFLRLRRSLPRPLRRGAEGEERALWRYFAGVLAVQLCLSVLTNADVLLIKALFSEETAGLYASASVLGKTVTYISGAVVASLFPLAASRQARGDDARPLLGKGLLYGGGLALACAAGLLWLGRFLIPAFFGARYAAAAAMLGSVCLYTVPLSLLTVLFHYLMALGRTKTLMLSTLGGCAALMALLPRCRGSVTAVTGLVGAVLLLLLLAGLPAALRKEKTE